ncbi:MAG: hypothetical protein HKN36_02455 [Hellea sp.]|nr:hypothetical protein [Hellea sp.]
MLPRSTYRFAILIAGLFLIFQGMGIAHASNSEDQSHHVDCVLCHVVSDNVDVTVLPVDDVDALEIERICLPAFYDLTSSEIWSLTPPERAPPPRGPPTPQI